MVDQASGNEVKAEFVRDRKLELGTLGPKIAGTRRAHGLDNVLPTRLDRQCRPFIQLEI